MKIKYYWNLLRGKTNAERPAKLTLRNIFAVFQAKKREMAGFLLEDHIYEQIIWRRIEVMSNSPRCWHSGKCKVCGCEILGKTMEDRACSITEDPYLSATRRPCYPAMMNKEQWKEHKKLKNIKLFN